VPAATVDAPTDKAAEEAEAALDAQMNTERLARIAGDSSGDPPAAQGNLDGSWEEIVGGNTPTERKVRIVGGAFQPDNAPAGGIKKGRIYHVVVELRASGYAADDTLDPETKEPASTTETKKLRVIGGHFLTGPELDALNAVSDE
jgi:hypothetical protein